MNRPLDRGRRAGNPRKGGRALGPCGFLGHNCLPGRVAVKRDQPSSPEAHPRDFSLTWVDRSVSLGSDPFDHRRGRSVAVEHDDVMAWVTGYEVAWRAVNAAAVNQLFTEDARYRP